MPGEAVAEACQAQEAPRVFGEGAEMPRTEEAPRVPGGAAKHPVQFSHTDGRSIASAVHRAARSGKVDMLCAMKELGYPRARKDYNGSLGTHAAAEEGQAVALRMLVRFGCPIEEKDDEGCTVAHLAAKAGQLEVLLALGDLGCPMGERDNDGGTAASTIEMGDAIDGPNAALPFCGVPNVTTTVSTSSFETPSSRTAMDKLPDRPLAIVTVSATAV